MSAKHTPGPWLLTIEPTDVNGVSARFSIRTAEKFSLAWGQSQEHLGEDGPAILEPELVANARLIAAAPELLDALRQTRQYIANEIAYAYTPDGRDFATRADFEASMVVSGLDTIIAKATGDAV